MTPKNRLRVATAVLSERIFAGYPTKDGRGFKEPRHDVTSDVLLAIRDKVGIGNEIEVAPEGGPVEFRIAVLPPAPSCTCMEVFGENPNCPLHGEGTPWAAENPEEQP